MPRPSRPRTQGFLRALWRAGLGSAFGFILACAALLGLALLSRSDVMHLGDNAFASGPMDLLAK